MGNKFRDRKSGKTTDISEQIPGKQFGEQTQGTKLMEQKYRGKNPWGDVPGQFPGQKFCETNVKNKTTEKSVKHTLGKIIEQIPG